MISFHIISVNNLRFDGIIVACINIELCCVSFFPAFSMNSTTIRATEVHRNTWLAVDRVALQQQTNAAQCRQLQAALREVVGPQPHQAASINRSPTIRQRSTCSTTCPCTVPPPPWMGNQSIQRTLLTPIAHLTK